MKKYISSSFLIGFTMANAQVIVGDAVGTAAVKTSVLLEFAAGNKGLILPYVRTMPTPSAATQGTLLLDASTATAARVKYSDGTNWIDLSGQNANVSAALAVQPSTAVVETDAKSIIGARTSAADGVLVLESSTKAMVLPTVSDVQNILSPSPGMLVYVNKSGAKRLAVYNGSKWSFWQAEIPEVSTVPTVTTATGRIWMDRNLGASQVATNSDDPQAFGDLYQWGRLSDGHQLRTSGNTNVLSSTDVPGHGDFITGGSDWRSPSNDALWQGNNGTNNPCPSGFRLPTLTEFDAEVAEFATNNADGAFKSPLKLTKPGLKFPNGAVQMPAAGLYWLSDVEGVNRAKFYQILQSNINSSSISRSYGLTVRCIKN